MANRKNTFLLKRSNVVNKVPSLGDIQLGEIALNTADAKLFSTYTGGLTGATEIREIGWDRVKDGVNNGGANEVFSGKSGTDLYFRTISGGTNTTVTTIGDIIKIDSTGGGGESNTASNLGVGEGIFAQKVGVDLQFKSLTSSGNTISISSDSTTINLEKNNQVSVVSVNSSYSATTTDEVIGVNTSSNPVTLYLPDSVSSGRLRYDIKDIGLNSLTNNITVLASGTDTIITSSSVSSIVLSNNGVSITLINDGSGQWWQI
jgi:hypothetical protein